MKLILLLLSAILGLKSCETSTSCRETPSHCYEIYEIQSIRIDDDGEYHIIAIDSDGHVDQFYDMGRLDVRYDNILKPELIRHVYTEGTYKDYESYQEGYPKAVLPIGYKIEMFDD